MEKTTSQKYVDRIVTTVLSNQDEPISIRFHFITGTMSMIHVPWKDENELEKRVNGFFEDGDIPLKVEIDYDKSPDVVITEEEIKK